MIRDGREVPESIKCWCGCTAEFHHVSASEREDGKRTIWYKCIGGHKTYHEIQESKIKVRETKRKPKVRMSKIRKDESNLDNSKTRNSDSTVNRMSK